MGRRIPIVDQVKMALEEAYQKGYACGERASRDAVDKEKEISEEDIVKNISKEEAKKIMWDEVRDLGYKEGLEKAWETARRIRLSERDGGLSMDECQEIFNQTPLYNIFKHMSVYDVIEALDKYDEQDKIHVGDEVKVIGTNVTGVVTGIASNNYVHCIRADGSPFTFKSKGVKKTGNHFAEVRKMLEALRGEKTE